MPLFADDQSLEPVAWDVAIRTATQALRLAPPFKESARRALEEDFAEATAKAHELVEQATGLRSSAGAPRANVVDRGGWVSANVGSFRRLLAPLADRLAKQNLAKHVLTPMNRSAAGVEVGLMLAWMSGRVLGQYDLLPFDGEDAGDVIYYVGPNVLNLEARHDFPPREFRLWIALHEVTHRVQFTGVPWMRDYFLGLVERGIGLEMPETKTVLEALRRAAGELRAGRNPLAEGGVVGLLASSEQLETLREAQALMSLLEGHGDVVMSGSAAAAIPGAKHFAEVLAARRASASGLAKLAQQALGLEAKMRQYAEGEQFVESVLASGGDPLLARVWESAEMLPNMDEIRDPALWIERVGGLARSSI